MYVRMDDVNVRPAGVKNRISTPSEREFGTSGSKGLKQELISIAP
jgi:hypothetical protein